MRKEASESRSHASEAESRQSLVELNYCVLGTLLSYIPEREEDPREEEIERGSWRP